MEEQKQTTQAPAPAPAPKGGEVEEGKIVGILLYIVWIVGIIWYFADDKMKNNSFAKYHAKQSIMLVILMVILYALTAVPVLGWFILSWLAPIVHIILLIIGIVNVVHGEKKPLPVIGKLAEKWFKF